MSLNWLYETNSTNTARFFVGASEVNPLIYIGVKAVDAIVTKKADKTFYQINTLPGI